jgi:hypothetical protein
MFAAFSVAGRIALDFNEDEIDFQLYAVGGLLIVRS